MDSSLWHKNKIRGIETQFQPLFEVLENTRNFHVCSKFENLFGSPVQQNYKELKAQNAYVHTGCHLNIKEDDNSMSFAFRVTTSISIW